MSTLYHSESVDASRLDVRQYQPGRAVAQGERPAADDDTLGSAQGTDVLKLCKYHLYISPQRRQ